MAESQIAGKARFDAIRYAQLWEDADVLTAALEHRPGATLVSICSAGDNALAMLTLDPARVVVVDLSPAQIACLELRERHQLVHDDDGHGNEPEPPRAHGPLG
jgi:S-adenosylmethionine-diacylglycerol 3-amino-3-carboxypropyl transferase